MKLTRLALAAAVAACFSPALHAADAFFSSPGGQLQAAFGGPVKNGKGEDQGFGTYALSYKGRPLITPSLLDLKLALPAAEGADFRFVGASAPREVDQAYAIVAGKARSARDHFREMTLSYEDKARPGRKIDIVFRLYDQGAAFRYVIHGRAGERIAIRRETSTFQFAADYDCWGYNQGQWRGSQEGEYDPVKASRIRDTALMVLPLVCKTGQGGATFALAESDVKDYPVTYFSGRGDGSLGVELKQPVRFDTAPGLREAVSIADVTVPAGGFKTPWRVLMVGDQPGALAEGNLVQMLAEPSRIKDTSWIKPGKVSWDWWNGAQANVPQPGMNTATYRAFIDFAAETGLEYVMIDEGWSVGSSIEPNPRADVTRPIPAMDMPGLIAYAKSKGVGIWVWLQWEQLERQMDKALAAYEKWGVKGIKVDFMNRSDQEMVGYYHRLIGKAAQHKLMVDMHGGFPSVGMERTWPNLITQEGVMGAEYNKWSQRVTAGHNVTLPFTRMLVGPMDYTPGGFRHIPVAEMAGKKRWLNPYVQTTRGHALGMYVVYDSPLQMVADSPPAYRKADGGWEDGMDFIRQVPTTWDETRVLQGDIGQFIVTARRSGKDWYIGAMSNEQGRDISLPLDFLGEGRYAATVWEDGAAMNTLNTHSAELDRSATLKLRLAGSGGAAVVLRRR